MRNVLLIFWIIFFMLLAGTLVNVGIAWSAAKWSTIGSLDVQRTAQLRRTQFGRNERSERDENIWIRGVWGNRWLDMVDMNVESHDSTDRVFELRAGWPLRVLAGRRGALPVSPRGIQSADQPAESQYEWALMISGPDHELFADGPTQNFYFGSEFRYLPLKPIWPNALVSTAAFPLAGVLILLLAWLGRSAIRRWRGWCIRCGYDLRGKYQAGCPECGWGRVNMETTERILQQ